MPADYDLAERLGEEAFERFLLLAWLTFGESIFFLAMWFTSRRVVGVPPLAIW